MAKDNFKPVKIFENNNKDYLKTLQLCKDCNINPYKAYIAESVYKNEYYDLDKKTFEMICNFLYNTLPKFESLDPKIVIEIIFLLHQQNNTIEEILKHLDNTNNLNKILDDYLENGNLNEIKRKEK